MELLGNELILLQLQIVPGKVARARQKGEIRG